MAFYMQGEMGATVFFYPQQWLATANELRARLGPAAIVGVGLNNNKLWYVWYLCGVCIGWCFVIACNYVCVCVCVRMCM